MFFNRKGKLFDFFMPATRKASFHVLLEIDNLTTETVPERRCGIIPFFISLSHSRDARRTQRISYNCGISRYHRQNRSECGNESNPRRRRRRNACFVRRKSFLFRKLRSLTDPSQVAGALPDDAGLDGSESPS